MPKKESIQHKLDRVRPPREHITYDVEVGGAIENKELPFVLGVLGDFSGQPEEPLPRVRDRKLIEIDRDNFDQVLAAMKPRLHLFGHHHEFTDSMRQGVRSIGLDIVTKSYMLVDVETFRCERLDT